MMTKYSTVVIGGGAAGIVAAISAKRRDSSVLICERMPRIGKKILASGNGRCNLLNDDISESSYNPAARTLAKAVFSKFGKDAILKFFKELGLLVYSDRGRLFPVTNQASSVLKVLEMELDRLKIAVELDFDAIKVSGSDKGFIVTSRNGKNIACDKVIIAGGGRSYPALGSDGGAYKLAKDLGHHIVGPVPAAVPLVIKDRLCHLLQGQKVPARVKALIGGRQAAEAEGELLFAKYGLSGTAILDVSEEISIAINRAKDRNVFVSIDTAPHIAQGALDEELVRRVRMGFAANDIFTGILPNKFGPPFKDISNIKDVRFKVAGTRGWNEAEFTAGGVNLDEVDRDTLESKRKRGLYFAGEVLDVNGKRGGYNLAWAWASGYVAGQQ